MTVSLIIRPLTAVNFSPFGDVIDLSRSDIKTRAINDGTTTRFHRLSTLETEGAPGIVSIFRGQPRSFPYEIGMMERHPLGSQTFYPLSNRPWLVIAAEDYHGPRTPKVFLANGRQGITYRRNVWHHPLMALDEESDFLVIDRDDAESGDSNLEEHTYDHPFLLEKAVASGS
ncbi:MAG: ureidoglycolate lyase [Pseudomonadota bacterium]